MRQAIGKLCSSTEDGIQFLPENESEERLFIAHDIAKSTWTNWINWVFERKSAWNHQRRVQGKRTDKEVLIQLVEESIVHAVNGNFPMKLWKVESIPKQGKSKCSHKVVVEFVEDAYNEISWRGS